MSGKWVDKSGADGTRWLVYQTNPNSLHIAKSPHYGVPTANMRRSYGWCYFYPDCGVSGWIPMENVTTEEEAKALALVLWRMGE